ncbi:hypothetical protein ACFL9T_02450 [Thermodesulfobacteriota bacterium]
MHIIKNDKKYTFGIVGLPRSGTSILGHIFDSLENGFCWSEPHWQDITNSKKYSLEKIKKKYFGSLKYRMKFLIDEVNNSKSFEVGGVKETFNSFRRAPANYIFKSDVDLIVLIFREPKSCFNSIKRLNWGNKFLDIDIFIKDYLFLYKKISMVKNKKLFTIKYESLCDKSALTYLNCKFEKLFKIQGELKLVNTENDFGDPDAYKSKKIKAAKMDHCYLNSRETQKIDKLIFPLWEAIDS